ATLHPPFEYTAQVVSFDDRFNLLRVRAVLLSDGEPVAEAMIASFVRGEPDDRVYEAIAARLTQSDALAGKVALVIGASRGLGAAVAQLIAFEGGTVFAAFHESRQAALKLQASTRNAPGELE